MLKLQNISIKNKLVLMILGVSFFSLFIGFGIELFNNVKTIKKEMLEYSIIQTKMLAEYCVVPLTFESKEGIDQILEKLDNRKNILAAIVYDTNGKVFTYYTKSEDNLKIQLYSKDLATTFFKNYLQVIEPIEYNNVYYGELAVNFSTEQLDLKIKSVIKDIIISLVFLFILSLLLANYLQKYFSKPIVNLARITETISSSGDYQNIIKTDRKDEIGRLYNSFHHMMNQLNEDEERIKNYNEKLLYSLHEKEVLLKEIHHRVKNNLQIIVSLLNLQIKQSDNIDAQNTLEDCKNRVYSMSVVHEKMYQTADLASINFHNYIESLVLHFKSIYKKDEKITIQNNVDNTSFNINYAIPLGLILNELISNSFKHAFPDQKDGQISITLGQNSEGRYHLLFEDNGVGFSGNMYKKHEASLGINLIMNLVKQLDADIKFNNTPGAQVIIDFQIPEEKN